MNNDESTRTARTGNGMAGRPTPDSDDIGAFKPMVTAVPRRSNPGSRGGRNGERDVVAMMKRDMSYSAVAASAHHRDQYDSDDDSASLISGSSENPDATNGSGTRGSTYMSRITEHNKTASPAEAEEEALEAGIAWRRKLVLMLWCVVACLVIVAIAAVGVGIQKEKDDHQKLEELTESDGKSSDLLISSLQDASQQQQHNLQTSLKSLAQSLTASSASPTQWPFVTTSLMAVQGQSTRAINPAIEFIAFSPLVATRQQFFWHNYSWSHQDWIQQDWKIENDHKNNTIMMYDKDNQIAPEIYQDVQAVENPFDYSAPLWLTSPPPHEPNKLNHDVLSVASVLELYQKLLQGSHNAVLSPLLSDLPSLYGFAQTNNTDDNESRSILLLPVQDILLEDENPQTVGLLQVVVNWGRMLDDLLDMLPKTTTRKATLQNDCEEPKVLERTITDDFIAEKGHSSGEGGALVVEQELLGSPDIGGCSYSLRMELKSTSDEEASAHNISGILVLALVPLALVLVTLALDLMLLLEWMGLVDDRYEKLKKTSDKSSAIVASMFPSTIRDRLYADEEEAAKNKDGKVGKDGKIKDGSGKRDGKRLLRTSLTVSCKAEPPKELATDAIALSETENNNMTIQEEGENLECYPEGHPRIAASGSERLKTYLDTGSAGDDSLNQAPIADLFPNCTVLFADISGFTAWSSVREPSQVFTLLETLYKKFDDIAKKRGVFKVETVGDCYVAVTGLPEPQDEHALIMVRFARDCMYKSYELTKKLEVTLGPDTAELSMRFGLHSGPVTAGVLRMDRARFQLFGDTVNTASRMESTGQKGRIQMSQETADLLVMAGKQHLIRQREDTVTAKGKGEMTTYWLALGADPDDMGEEKIPKPTMLCRNQSGVESILEENEDETDDSDEDTLNDSSTTNRSVATNRTMLTIRSAPPKRRKPPAVSMSGLHALKAFRDKKQSKESRLVDWNVEVLGKLLKQVISRRNALGKQAATGEVKLERPDGQTVLEEVREIITLPKFDASAARKQEEKELNPVLKEQLHDYVSTLASMYRDNPFHNYEHASHVTMSVVKLLSRIVAPKTTEGMTSAEKLSSELHDHTYGITSDPLTQFAVVMSALIHDVDHTGVPNSQLVKENAKVAAYYKNQSVAEQNSVDMSWSLLMEPQFRLLRNAIYCDEAELTRFRSLIVNAVMATDIVDKELKQLRNNRWDKAFSGDDPVTEEEVHAAVNRKATIVLEHLIQASDVSHTMQHWHVYRKWNERLFHEMYHAYRAGRAEKDPAEFWYKGEIGFFDFYIIPLAKKLKDCGVFGVSSDEYLNYAMKNREEWARKGEAVTAEMVAKARDKDLARLERQASVRGPLIAEMKAAVASMRTPQKAQPSFRQASFRHLRAEPQSTETIAMPHHGFRRQPPGRGVKSAVSIGAVDRNSLIQFRQNRINNGGLGSFSSHGHPPHSNNSLLSNLSDHKSVATTATAPGALGTNSTIPETTPEATSSMNSLPSISSGASASSVVPGPPAMPTRSVSIGMRKPERRCSNV